MVNMTTEQIVENIQKNCGVGKFGGNLPSGFFVGATNNPERRKAEHNINDFVDSYTMFKKEYAQDVLTKLAELGFDIGAEPGNGQDDSKQIYVYKKTRYSKEDLVSKVSINFKSGAYDENRYDQLPDTEGIYACFACTVNKDGTYHCVRTMYVGMTEKQGFKKRIDQHVKQDHSKWKKHIDPKTEHLVYVIAEDGTDILQTIESALIYKNQPLANDEYKDHYQGEYKQITVECIGNKGILREEITAVFEKKVSLR